MPAATSRPKCAMNRPTKLKVKHWRGVRGTNARKCPPNGDLRDLIRFKDVPTHRSTACSLTALRVPNSNLRQPAPATFPLQFASRYFRGRVLQKLWSRRRRIAHNRSGKRTTERTTALWRDLRTSGLLRRRRRGTQPVFFTDCSTLRQKDRGAGMPYSTLSWHAMLPFHFAFERFHGPATHPLV